MQIQEVLKLKPVPLSAKEFSELLDRAVRELTTLNESPIKNTSHEDLKNLHHWLRLSIEILDLFIAETRKFRELTETESRLLSDLDRCIGETSLRAARYARGLKQFEALDSQLLM